MSEHDDPKGRAPWQAPALPPKGIGVVKVLKPVGATPLGVTVLSERPTCIWTHWIHGKPWRCSGVEFRCSGCLARHRQIWSAWVAVWCDPPGRSFAMELSAGAVEYYDGPHFRDESLSFRGWRMQLSRLGGRSKGPLKLEMKPPTVPGQALPPAFDLVHWLEQFYQSA